MLSREVRQHLTKLKRDSIVFLAFTDALAHHCSLWDCLAANCAIMRLSLGLRVSIGGVGKEERNANKHPKVNSFESMMDGNLVHLQALLCLDYKTPQHHIARKAFPFVNVILLRMIRPIPFRVRLVKPSRTICTAPLFSLPHFGGNLELLYSSVRQTR